MNEERGLHCKRVVEFGVGRVGSCRKVPAIIVLLKFDGQGDRQMTDSVLIPTLALLEALDRNPSICDSKFKKNDSGCGRREVFVAAASPSSSPLATINQATAHLNLNRSNGTITILLPPNQYQYIQNEVL